MMWAGPLVSLGMEVCQGFAFLSEGEESLNLPASSPV